MIKATYSGQAHSIVVVIIVQIPLFSKFTPKGISGHHGSTSYFCFAFPFLVRFPLFFLQFLIVCITTNNLFWILAEFQPPVYFAYTLYVRQVS